MSGNRKTKGNQGRIPKPAGIARQTGEVGDIHVLLLPIFSVIASGCVGAVFEWVPVYAMLAHVLAIVVAACCGLYIVFYQHHATKQILPAWLKSGLVIIVIALSGWMLSIVLLRPKVEVFPKKLLAGTSGWSHVAPVTLVNRVDRPRYGIHLSIIPVGPSTEYKIESMEPNKISGVIKSKNGDYIELGNAMALEFTDGSMDLWIKQIGPSENIDFRILTKGKSGGLVRFEVSSDGSDDPSVMPTGVLPSNAK